MELDVNTLKILSKIQKECKENYCTGCPFFIIRKRGQWSKNCFFSGKMHNELATVRLPYEWNVTDLEEDYS